MTEEHIMFRPPFAWRTSRPVMVLGGNEQLIGHLFCIEIPGKPVTKGSFRAFVGKNEKPVLLRSRPPKRKDGTRAADPVKYEKYCREVIASKWRCLPIEKPNAVIVRLLFLLAPPKKRTCEYPTTKPDCDKLARTLLDAMTGVVYEDDSQVTDLEITKRYDDSPRVQVSIVEPLVRQPERKH